MVRNLPVSRVPEAWAGGRDLPSRSPVIPLPIEPPTHEAAERFLAGLHRARLRERRLRVALFALCLVTLAWLAPVSPWSPAELPLGLTLGAAALLGAAMAALAWLHHWASSPQALLTGTRRPAPPAPAEPSRPD